MDDSRDPRTDRLLREALGPNCNADFESWKARHADALAYLNPVVTEIYQKRYRAIQRVASFAIAACLVMAVVFFMFSTERQTFAQALEAVRKAQTVSWVSTAYMRCVARDKAGVWLEAHRSEHRYQAPGLLRTNVYDPDGTLIAVEIVDASEKKAIRYYPLTRTYVVGSKPRSDIELPPFQSIAKVLVSFPLQYIGQRVVNESPANVFRVERKDIFHVVDVWIDAKSKQLVGFNSPYADKFDPLTAEDRLNPRLSIPATKMIVGSVCDNIKINPEFETSTFDLTPPSGYQVSDEPSPKPYSEAEFVEFLGSACRANGDVFAESLREFVFDLNHRISTKPVDVRTDAEKELVALLRKHILNYRTTGPESFVGQGATRESFRYIGKGVRLGQADRIVCYYKLASTLEYRAVFGDLSVRSVSPDELPLPIQ